MKGVGLKIEMKMSSRCLPINSLSTNNVAVKNSDIPGICTALLSRLTTNKKDYVRGQKLTRQTILYLLYPLNGCNAVSVKALKFFCYALCRSILAIYEVLDTWL